MCCVNEEDPARLGRLLGAAHPAARSCLSWMVARRLSPPCHRLFWKLSRALSLERPQISLREGTGQGEGTAPGRERCRCEPGGLPDSAPALIRRRAEPRARVGKQKEALGGQL